jgi:hypothetical protein
MSENEGTAVAPQDTRKITLGAGSVVAIIPQTFDEVYRMATIIVKSGIGPKGMNEAQCAVAIMAGAEVGVAPMASVQNIAVINGRPCMWGDLIVGLVQASGKLEYLVDTWDEPTQTATVRIKRIGKPEHVETFGPTEAKRGKLDQKDTYKMWPQRMHGWRAKGFGIRSEFADVLKGLSIREEVEDYIDVDGRELPAPTALPPMPRAVEDTSEPEAPQPEPETERTLEGEIREVGECIGKKPAEIAALIKQHAKAGTLEQLRDEFRAKYRAPAEG